MNNFLHLIPAARGWRVCIYDPMKYKGKGPITRDVVAFALRKDGAVVPLIGTSNGIDEVPTPTALGDVYLIEPSDESINVSAKSSASETSPLYDSHAEPLVSFTDTERVSPIASKVLRFIAEAHFTPVPYEVLVETFGEVNANIAITELLLRSLIKNDAVELWSYHATGRGKNHVAQTPTTPELTGRS